VINQLAPTVAVVPARGGSKGIPGKNLANVAGLPLIAWTLLAASNADLPIRLIVTTDSQDIADVAKGYGSEVIRRPQHLALDESPTEPAIVHALRESRVSDEASLLLLQPTSPIRNSGSIDRAHATFVESGRDTLVAVVEEAIFDWSGPPEDPHPHYNTNMRPRRQDFRPEEVVYRETGSIYISRVAPFIQAGNRIHGSTTLFVMAKSESIDIDDSHDLVIADAVLRHDLAGLQ